MRTYGLRYGLLCAALWVLLKMIVFLSGRSIDWFDFTVMANNFLLLSAVALSIFFYKRSENFKSVPQLEDIKAGIFGGMIYTVAIVLFSFIYNSKIDESVLRNKIDQRIEQIAKAIETEEGYLEYKKINSDAAKYTREEIIERERNSTAFFINPKVSALLLLLFFTLLTLFYALFVTLTIRKIYLPGWRKHQ
jgi:hypothetical protein